MGWIADSKTEMVRSNRLHRSDLAFGTVLDEHIRLEGLPVVETSLVQTISQTPHEIHSFVKNRNNEGGRILLRQTEDVVMLASHHPQRWIERTHILERYFAHGKVLHSSLQSRDVVAYLGGTPLRTRVPNDRT